MADANELLIQERRDACLWLTFNRPEKANAWTADMLERAAAAIEEAGRDPGVRAIALTSVGERFFSAGVDVREKPQDGDIAGHRERRSAAHAALQNAAMDVAKPVVVVLNGTAIGGGAMLALLADACVAVDTAELSLPEIDLGIATFSGASILEAIGGRALALDLIQSGRRMPAKEALNRGLLAKVATRTELDAVATAHVHALASKDPRAFADNKQWINRSLKVALEEAREQHARHRASPSK